MLVWAPNGICDVAAGILRAAGHQVMVTPMLCGRSYIVHWTRRMEPFLPVDNTTIIACPATGTEHLDAAREAGIKVLSLRDCGDLSEIRASTEFSMSAILDLARNTSDAVAGVDAGRFDRMEYQGTDLYGKTALIVGCGRIGSAVDDILRFGFRMGTLLYDPRFNLGQSLAEMLPHADLVTVHCDLNPTSRAMFGPAQFAAMKPGVLFCNTSRGAVVDEAALLDALRSGQVAAAFLDVACDEPMSPSSPLVQYRRENPRRLKLTPHIAGNSRESLARAETLLARRLVQELQKP